MMAYSLYRLGYGQGKGGIVAQFPAGIKDFLFSKASRPSLGSIQPPSL